MRLLISLCLCLCFFLPACASPYQPQANAMTAAYQRGDMSAADYHANMTQLQALDLQRRQELANRIQRAFPPPPQNYNVYYYRVR